MSFSELLPRTYAEGLSYAPLVAPNCNLVNEINRDTSVIQQFSVWPMASAKRHKLSTNDTKQHEENTNSWLFLVFFRVFRGQSAGVVMRLSAKLRIAVCYTAILSLAGAWARGEQKGTRIWRMRQIKADVDQRKSAFSV